jgi:hypothetical protein
MRIGGRFGSFDGTLLVVFVIAVAGLAAWLVLPGPSEAQNEGPASPSPTAAVAQTALFVEPATAPAEPAPAGSAQGTTPTGTPAAAPPETATVQKPPIDGLKIASQSWRRGGLGSKVLVTLTLRNANDYAVKDIELACAFARRDGSHLTDRKRVITDTINMRSRKTYAGMLVGFVNINADKAKCSLVTASRIETVRPEKVTLPVEP